MREVELGNAHIRRRYLSHIEQHRVRCVVALHVFHQAVWAIRRKRDRKDLHLARVLLLNRRELRSKSGAMRAGGLHEFDDDYFAAIVVEIAPIPSSIDEAETGRAPWRALREEHRCRAEQHQETFHSARFLKEVSYGGRATPFSVIMPVTYRAGVTSNAGFFTSVPGGATGVPNTCVTSAADRSSIGI